MNCDIVKICKFGTVVYCRVRKILERDCVIDNAMNLCIACNVGVHGGSYVLSNVTQL